jgi:hypothetical protein
MDTACSEPCFGKERIIIIPPSTTQQHTLMNLGCLISLPDVA